MTTAKLKPFSQSLSGKKCQSVAVDMIISYLIFSFFLLYMSTFLLDLIKPFSSQASEEIMDKMFETKALGFRLDGISEESMDDVCSQTTQQINAIRASYEAKTAIMPYYDELPLASQGINIQRAGSNMLINFSTGDFRQITLNVFSTNASIANQTYNIYNTYSITPLNNSNEIEISANSTDSYQIFELSIENDAIIIFDFKGYEEVFFGKTRAYYSCGDYKTLEQKKTMSSYASIGSKKLIANYFVEAWLE